MGDQSAQQILLCLEMVRKIALGNSSSFSDGSGREAGIALSREDVLRTFDDQPGGDA